MMSLAYDTPEHSWCAVQIGGNAVLGLYLTYERCDMQLGRCDMQAFQFACEFHMQTSEVQNVNKSKPFLALV
jgi:hypothetical protein